MPKTLILLFYIAITTFIVIVIQEVAQVRIEGPFWWKIVHQTFVMMTGAGFVWIWQCLGQSGKSRAGEDATGRTDLEDSAWK